MSEHVNAMHAVPGSGAVDNTSGMGKFHATPDGVKGWSWGGFVFSWI